VAVKSEDGALCLITLHYGSDLLPAQELSPKMGAIDSRAKNLALKEIKKMVSDFAPEKYADQRRARIVEYLRKKAEATAPVEGPAMEGREERGEGPGPPDLVAALREAMRTMKKKR
jgi:non-homologous end joining protein Ku